MKEPWKVKLNILSVRKLFQRNQFIFIFTSFKYDAYEKVSDAHKI